MSFPSLITLKPQHTSLHGGRKNLQIQIYGFKRHWYSREAQDLNMPRWWDQELIENKLTEIQKQE